jgi:hypothetical protein
MTGHYRKYAQYCHDLLKYFFVLKISRDNMYSNNRPPANLEGPPFRRAVMKSTHATPTAPRWIPREIGVARVLRAVRMHDLLDHWTPCIGAANRTDATPRDEWRSSRGIIALALLNTCAHQQNANRSRIVAQTPIVATSRLKKRVSCRRSSLASSNRCLAFASLFSTSKCFHHHDKGGFISHQLHCTIFLCHSVI